MLQCTETTDKIKAAVKKRKLLRRAAIKLRLR
jgi:hypothetical protein